MSTMRTINGIADIPVPTILDPGAVELIQADNVSHSVKAERRAHRFDDLCEYGTKLWQEVNALRRYLVDCLPLLDGDTENSAASPMDDAGWERWIEEYARATAVLVGPRGDMGFAMVEARQQAQLHRGVG